MIGFRRLKWGESAFTVGWEVLCDREASIQERGRKEERNKKQGCLGGMRFSRYGQHLTWTGRKVPTRNPTCATHHQQLSR